MLSGYSFLIDFTGRLPCARYLVTNSLIRVTALGLCLFVSLSTTILALQVTMQPMRNITIRASEK